MQNFLLDPTDQDPTKKRKKIYHQLFLYGFPFSMACKSKIALHTYQSEDLRAQKLYVSSCVSAWEREREVQVLSFPSFGSVKFSRIPWSFVVHRYQKIREFETYHRMFYLRCSLPVVVFGDLRGQRVGVTYRSNFYVEYAPEVRYFWLKVSKV